MGPRLRYLPYLLVAAVCACGDDTASPAAASTTSSTGGEAGAGGDGGSAGEGGRGGAGAGGGGEGGAVPCASLSDEFDDASSLECWARREVVEGTPAQYELLDVDTTVPGQLVIEPTGSGWYDDDEGPFLYKELTGDFVVEVEAAALDEGDLVSAPSEPFHSAGLLARDPSSDQGTQDWVMYNLGRQEMFVGSEGKTTLSSMSVLTLLPGEHRGLLRMCRDGADIRLLRRLEGDAAWVEEHVYPRPDLPATLQVGLVINAWPPGGGDARNLHARFGYVRFGDPTAGCSADFVAR
jgi:hypothetical protein